MEFLQRSLATRLLVYVLLLIVLSLGVVGYIVYYSGRQSIVNQVETQLESVVTLKEQEIQNWVADLEHNLTWLAISGQIQSDAAILATRATDDPQYLAARDSLVAELEKAEIPGEITLVFLLDRANGKIVAASDSTWEGKFRESAPYFIQGKNRTYVSDIFHSLTLGRPTMVVSAPVKDSAGHLVGVLAAHANLERISEIMLARSGLGETGETYLVNKNNLLLTESRFVPQIAFKKWVFTEGVSQALEGKSGVALYLDYRGEPVIGAYHWLEDREMVLLAEIDQVEAFAPFYRLGNRIAIVGGLMFVLAGGIALLLARGIIQPIRRLVLATEVIARGNLDYTAGTTAKDEVGELSRAFDHMTKNLKEITASRDELNKEIAERKRAEEDIRKFKIIADNVAYGVSISDLDGKLIYANESYARMHGYTVNEVVGKHFSVFYTKEQAKVTEKRREKVLQMMGSYVGDEVWHKRKDGTFFPTLTTSTAVKDNKGKPSYISATHFDLTERKKAEEELRKHREHLEELVKERTNELRETQEQLVRKERLAVLGQLAGGVGHELRNPLGAIKNASYFLNMALEQPEPEVRETLGILEREVATSERIISSLLNFARPRSPTRRKVDVNKIVQDVLSFATIPENVRVVRQLGKSLPTIMADLDQIGQVFSNIIRNAIQAMPEGGQLLVKSEVFQPRWVAISFTDTGVGIPPEEQPKVFEPLFTTKAKGIGLGLAVTNTLVEGHGGTIEVQSKVGKGSTFTVRLPIGAEKEN